MTVPLTIGPCTLYCGDALQSLKSLADCSVQCCVTSPPYYGLRDYGVDGQIGLESTPEEYVARMVEVFGEVRRVMRPDGTCWINMGDSYNASLGQRTVHDKAGTKQRTVRGSCESASRNTPNLKPKDLCGIPWRLAFALQADGWWLRQDIIWHKPNPMPESVTDRCTKAHEYIFLLTKSARYYFDAEAIKEPSGSWNGSRFDDERDLSIRPTTGRGPRNIIGNMSDRGVTRTTEGLNLKTADEKTSENRNKRSVWTVPSAPYSEAHFATFPPDLIKPCILAGTSARGCCPKCGAPWERVVESEPYSLRPKSRPVGNMRGVSDSDFRAIGEPQQGNVGVRTKTTGWHSSCGHDGAPTFYDNPPMPCTVLDPFGGSGTTGMVAIELGRKAILIELNPDYIELARKRCDVTPGLHL